MGLRPYAKDRKVRKKERITFMKVLLILSDGMRPDGLDAHPAAARLMREGSYTLRARTVMPSVTLPCHMSLFHSVDPGRHGILTNTYVPQVRPRHGPV